MAYQQQKKSHKKCLLTDDGIKVRIVESNKKKILTTFRAQTGCQYVISRTITRPPILKQVCLRHIYFGQLLSILSKVQTRDDIQTGTGLALERPPIKYSPGNHAINTFMNVNLRLPITTAGHLSIIQSFLFILHRSL
jgi:hypothetical protein